MKKNFYISYLGVIGIFTVLVFSSYGCAHRIYYFEKPGETKLEAGHRTIQTKKNKRYLFVEKQGQSAIACIEAPPFSSYLIKKSRTSERSSSSYSEFLQQLAVSEVLKVAYYSLCQSTANGYIDEGDYSNKFEDLIKASKEYVILAGTSSSEAVPQMNQTVSE